MKKVLPLFFILFALSSKATHIVGGDITVKSLGSNNFEVTLILFFDCINGSTGAFDASASMGIYEKGTNTYRDSLVLPFVDSLRLQLGDTCFVPTNLCVKKLRYVATINLPNNVNGYYLSWHRCCRNSIITNIATPGASGNVFYAEIPNPAIGNSTPVFSSYPDAYMCVNYPNIDNFGATDADGDSLVYSLVDPYDCATTNLCSPSAGTPGPKPFPPGPGPYGVVTWVAPYTTTNMMGDPVQSINSQTGILSTTPPTQGVYVICVKVEEFNKTTKVKKGEVRRDVQYAVMPCTIPTINLTGPNPICLGKNTTLTASGGTSGSSYSWSTGATTSSIVVAPTAIGTYTFYVYTTVNPTCHTSGKIAINVDPLPQVVAFSDRTICPGYSASLSATGASTYTWSPSGSLDNANVSNPVATPPGSTAYIVAGTDTNGCVNRDTVDITIGTEPVAAYGIVQEMSCEGIYARFTDASLNATSWYWDFGDGTTSQVQNPVHTFPFNVSYNITLAVANPPCEDTLVQTLSSSAFIAIGPANVFTPNGDAKNDCFRPVLIGGSTDTLAQCIEMQIFDRWGIKVFESEGGNVCWDGKNRHNKKVVDGTYYYIATLGGTTIKGFVEVLR